jgi:hypothetical protein
MGAGIVSAILARLSTRTNRREPALADGILSARREISANRVLRKIAALIATTPELRGSLRHQNLSVRLSQ